MKEIALPDVPMDTAEHGQRVARAQRGPACCAAARASPCGHRARRGGPRGTAVDRHGVRAGRGRSAGGRTAVGAAVARSGRPNRAGRPRRALRLEHRIGSSRGMRTGDIFWRPTLRAIPTRAYCSPTTGSRSSPSPASPGSPPPPASSARPAISPPSAPAASRPPRPADLFSLGATLYAAVEGRGPFDRPGQYATLTALLGEEPTPPVRAGELTSVLHGLLVKDPCGGRRRRRSHAGLSGWCRRRRAGCSGHRRGIPQGLLRRGTSRDRGPGTRPDRHPGTPRGPLRPGMPRARLREPHRPLAHRRPLALRRLQGVHKSQASRRLQESRRAPASRRPQVHPRPRTPRTTRTPRRTPTPRTLHRAARPPRWPARTGFRDPACVRRLAPVHSQWRVRVESVRRSRCRRQPHGRSTPCAPQQEALVPIVALVVGDVLVIISSAGHRRWRRRRHEGRDREEAPPQGARRRDRRDRCIRTANRWASPSPLAGDCVKAVWSGPAFKSALNLGVVNCARARPDGQVVAVDTADDYADAVVHGAQRCTSQSAATADALPDAGVYAVAPTKDGFGAAKGGTACLVLGRHVAIGGEVGRFRDAGVNLWPTRDRAPGTAGATRRRARASMLTWRTVVSRTDQVIGTAQAAAGMDYKKALAREASSVPTSSRRVGRPTRSTPSSPVGWPVRRSGIKDSTKSCAP